MEKRKIIFFEAPYSILKYENSLTTNVVTRGYIIISLKVRFGYTYLLLQKLKSTYLFKKNKSSFLGTLSGYCSAKNRCLKDMLIFRLLRTPLVKLFWFLEHKEMATKLSRNILWFQRIVTFHSKLSKSLIIMKILCFLANFLLLGTSFINVLVM